VSPNEAAAEPKSAASPSQDAAAANIGVEPAPLNNCAELISGGNTEKFMIVVFVLSGQWLPA
jgi:hypothetical protein